jgi:hypothetical protein
MAQLQVDLDKAWLRDQIDDFSRQVGKLSVMLFLFCWLISLFLATILRSILPHPNFVEDNRLPATVAVVCLIIAIFTAIRIEWHGEIGERIRAGTSKGLPPSKEIGFGVFSGFWGIGLGIGYGAMMLFYVIVAMTYFMLVPIVLGLGLLGLLAF